MRHEVREQDRGQNEGQNRGQNRGAKFLQNEGQNRASGTKRNYTRFQGPHHLWQEKVRLVHIVVRCPHHLKFKMQEYFSLGGCAGLDIYNIFVYLNVIARIFHFGRVCWSWYLQYFCIFECYCKNISLWEGVLVLISTIFLYIWMLLQEYFTLGGCAGLDIYNIFVYLNVIARIFHFGRVCWSWYLQYFCIFVYWHVIARIFHFGRVCWLWKVKYTEETTITAPHHQNPCLAPSLASIYNTVSPPNYDNVRFPPPWGMRWGNKIGGIFEGQIRGAKQGVKWGAKQGVKQGAK